MSLPEGWKIIDYKQAFSQLSTTHKKVKTKECTLEGTFPVVDQGQELICGYFEDEEKLIKLESPVVVFGDHTRVIKWINFDFIPGADGTKILNPKDVFYPKFFYYQMRNIVLPDKGYSRHFKFLKEVDFVLPPLKEQKQIAQKLDQVLARVERIKIALDNTPNTIKRFRQSVLALATSGRVSEGKEYCSIQVNDEKYMLVEGWELLEISNFSLKTRPAIKSGPFGSLLKKYEHIESGIPVLGIENIDNMYFKYGSKIHISEKKALDLDVYDIQANDIIISRSGTVGEICKVPSNIGIARYSTNIIRVVLDNDLVSSDYFCFLFQGNNLVLNQVKDLCKGSTRVFLNKTILSNIKFPIPSLEEQKAIVKKVETLFTLADNLEKRVNQAQKQVDRLTQSILAKAFRGEL